MTAALNLPDDYQDKQDWTVDDLASLPEDLHYELIDGRLVLSSPTAAHQQICFDIAHALKVNCPGDLHVSWDLSLRINPRNEPRPDVLVIGFEHSDQIPLPVEDAVLAVEVISPGSVFRDNVAKMEVYAASGITSYWMIDQSLESGLLLTEFRLGADRTYDLVSSTSKVFTADVPYPVTVDLPEITKLWRRLAKRPEPTAG